MSSQITVSFFLSYIIISWRSIIGLCQIMCDLRNNGTRVLYYILPTFRLSIPHNLTLPKAISPAKKHSVIRCRKKVSFSPSYRYSLPRALQGSRQTDVFAALLCACNGAYAKQKQIVHADAIFTSQLPLQLVTITKIITSAFGSQKQATLPVFSVGGSFI